MGRKIPAKKHRGVKDPLVQQAKRLESLKGKINAPPKDPDEQPVPRSLLRLFGLKDPDKKVVNKKKNQSKTWPKTHVKDNTVKSSSDNPISHLKKLPGESGRGFSLRINSAMKALHTPEEDLDYPQDLEADDYKGQRMVEQRERRAKKHARALKAKRARDGGTGDAPQEHLTRTQKLALKKKAKKIKALEASAEKAEVVYERVSFGDVSHAPPSLHFKTKTIAGAPRPGRRDLLLNKLWSREAAPAANVADALRRERARNDAVAAYRALKAAKYKKK